MPRPFIVVSSNTRRFADDLNAFCARCGTIVYYRPHSPVADERICNNCFAKHPLLGAGLIVRTPETRREIALDLNAKGKPQ